MAPRTTSKDRVAIRLVDKGNVTELGSVSQKGAMERAEELAKGKEAILVSKIMGGLWLGPQTLVEINIVLGGVVPARRLADKLAAGSKGKVEYLEDTRQIPPKVQPRRASAESGNKAGEWWRVFNPDTLYRTILEGIVVCEWTDQTHAADNEAMARMAKARAELHAQRREVARANRNLREFGTANPTFLHRKSSSA